MVGWALSIGLIDLPFSHWTHVTFKQRGAEDLRDSERTYESTHPYLGTAGRKTRKGTVGCERAGGVT